MPSDIVTIINSGQSQNKFIINHKPVLISFNITLQSPLIIFRSIRLSNFNSLVYLILILLYIIVEYFQKESMKMKKQSFLQGALILMLAGFINRTIGFILRILIVRIIGDEGLGLFQMIYPLFITLLLLSTGGFPIAISKLIPEKLTRNDYRGSYNLLKVSLLFVFITSTIIMILLYFSGNFLANNI